MIDNMCNMIITITTVVVILLLRPETSERVGSPRGVAADTSLEGKLRGSLLAFRAGHIIHKRTASAVRCDTGVHRAFRARHLRSPSIWRELRGSKGMGVVSNSWFAHVLLSIVYIFKPMAGSRTEHPQSVLRAARLRGRSFRQS